MCRNRHENKICENSSCEIFSCSERHPRECRYFKEYNRCKFNPCNFKHVAHLSQETEFGKLKDEHLKTVVKVAEFEKLLSEKKELENNIRTRLGPQCQTPALSKV